jgi:PQQ-dependent dehydrogenase (methanol/ethanol family)
VNTDRLLKVEREPGSWLTTGNNYEEQRFSQLDQINETNVSQLGLAWYADIDTERGQESTPIVVDGVMYLTTAWSMVKAYDIKSGALLWAYDPKIDRAKGADACCDVVTRGVAAWNGKIYVGTLDGRLVALNGKTGQVVWEKQTTDTSLPYTITGVPRIVKGKVIIGNGGAEYRVRGYLTAYDAETGEQAWRWYSVPGDASKPQEQPELKDIALPTWKGEWWKLGGGGTLWDGMAYDPELDLIYVGVGNGTPWNQKYRSPGGGDNLFLASIVALDPNTGKYKWHYQTTPGETWDYTATQPLILADLKIGSETQKVLMQAPKNGFFYVIDRATGKLISADKYQDNINWAKSVDLATGRPVEDPGARYLASPFQAIPGPLGAHNWHPMAFSPDTGLVYIPAHTLPQLYTDEVEHQYRPGFWNTGIEFAGVGPTPPLNERLAARAALKGQLVAWDPVAKKPRWVHDYPTPWNGGVLATAGGLVFQGGLDGKFRAFDAATGAMKWETEGHYPVMSGPISYEIDGEQYIAVTAGWGTALPLTGGAGAIPKVGSAEMGRVLVYKIGGKAELPPYEVFEVDPIPAAEDFGSAQQLERGRLLYDRNCMVCHGPFVVSSGAVQDLRWAQAPGTKEDFAEVVLNGKYASAGMASFAATLTPADAESVRAYIINRAHEDAKAAASATPAPN